jgi:exosortase
MSQLTQIELLSEKPLLVSELRTLWWQPLVIVVLTGWLYSTILSHLLLQWRDDSNFSHGFFVPVFSIFVLWRDRARLRSLPRKPSSWGLLIIAFSLGMLVVGVLGAELFLARVSLLFLVVGLILVFFGASYFRAMFFPLSVLFLMIPIPTIVFNEITLPLQILASKLAAVALPWLGVPVLREGNIINLPAMSLEVVDACSGIRSLLSLITLAVIYGYLMTSLKWVRVILAFAAIPIAIVANSLRIVVTGLLVQYWNPNKAEGFFHIFSGWLVFLVAVVMLCLLQQLLVRGRMANE